MFLTEEQIVNREDKFMDFALSLVEGLDESEIQESISEKQAYVLSVVMEHFVEQYQPLTLAESAIMAETGDFTDFKNESLYEDVEAILTEAGLIGALGAALRAGAAKLGAKFSYNMATRQHNAAKVASDKAQGKHDGQVAKTNNATANAKSAISNGSPIAAAIKAAVAAHNTAKMGKTGDAAKAASEREGQAAKTKDSALGKYGSAAAKSNRANRQLKVASNEIRNKVTSSVEAGAAKVKQGSNRLMGAIGRKMGSMAAHAAVAVNKAKTSVGNSSFSQAFKQGYSETRNA